METEPPQEVNNTAAADGTENSQEPSQEEATNAPNGEEIGEPATEDTPMAQVSISRFNKQVSNE
jgi:hypothetical protein